MTVATGRGARRAQAAGAAWIAVLATLAGCTSSGAGGNSPAGDTADAAQVADTIRGVIGVVGAEPLTRVVMRTGSPLREVALTGPVADTFRSLVGVEVMVRLPSAPDTTAEGAAGGLRPTAFRVRALEDTPAVDGVLEVEGDVAILTTASGERLRYPSAPAGLRDLAGQRVWISGPKGQVWQWGRIEAP